MFPIRDHNPSTRPAYLRNGLILVNVAVFLAYWFGLSSDRAVQYFFLTWGLVPKEIIAGQDWVTVLTSMFLHGGWLHLIGNMWFLWIFGDNLEDELGHAGFALLYFGSGLGAAALQVASGPYSPVPMVGASGAIAGVMGGYLLLFPKARIDVLFIFIIFFRIFPIPAWIVLGAWIGMQLFSGFSTPTIGIGQGVAYWAHIGGFAAGLALCLPGFLRRGGRQFWARNDGHPPHEAAQYPLSRSSIPRIPRR